VHIWETIGKKRQFTRYAPVPETLYSGKSPAIKTGLLAITRWVISLEAGFFLILGYILGGML
jgi:hypothetical protein